MSLSAPPARRQRAGLPQRRFGEAALEAHAGAVEEEHEGVSWRLCAHLLLAALPLLAISAHVFGLVPMHLSAGLLVVPLLVAVAVATGFRPVPADRVLPTEEAAELVLLARELAGRELAPRAAAADTSRHRSTRLTGSTPVLGSSRTSSGGSCSIARQNASF